MYYSGWGMSICNGVSSSLVAAPFREQEPSDKMAIRGMRVTLECKVVAHPQANLTLRRRNSSVLQNTTSNNELSYLLAANASFSDSGSYECFAINIFGSFSYSFRLIVQGKHVGRELP